MDIKARNKQVKTILSKKFGRENVSVKNGRGTSWGWCYINLQITKISSCQCLPDSTYCQPCRTALNQASKEATTMLRGFEFYEYTDDMNFDQQEVLLQIHFGR